MLMLGSSLVYMVIAGRRREKQQQQTPHPIEIIQHSRPSATRISSPEDLEIIEIRLEPVQPTAGITAIAQHSIEIRNKGIVTYNKLMLRVSYFKRDGKLIETRDYSLKNVLPPGKNITLQNIPLEPLPSKPVKWSGRLVYGDMEPSPTAK